VPLLDSWRQTDPASPRSRSLPPLFKYPHFFIALIAFVIADIAVSMLSKAAKRIGALDQPELNTYKVQKQAVPFIGGIGLFIGFIGAVLISLN
jgi:UDP-N-acetylmuramyl pentapeptide phosphotransferase/UDP-N-acetylglucosamine-1-phosphate transferase